MNGLELEINPERLAEGFARAPDALWRRMRGVVAWAIQSVSVGAKTFAPKAFTTLAHAIRSHMLDSLTGEVTTAGARYAKIVEEGGRPQHLPPLMIIIDWMRVKRIVPRNPKETLEDVAYKIARTIAARGTPKQPFMRPALGKREPEILRRADEAVRLTLAEIGA